MVRYYKGGEVQMKFKKTKSLLVSMCLGLMIAAPVMASAPAATVKAASYQVSTSYNPSKSTLLVTVYNCYDEDTAMTAFENNYNSNLFTRVQNGFAINSDGYGYEFSYGEERSYGYLLFFSRVY